MDPPNPSVNPPDTDAGACSLLFLWYGSQAVPSPQLLLLLLLMLMLLLLLLVS
jgi:hypothetical protein